MNRFRFISLLLLLLTLTACVKDTSKKSVTTQLLQSQNPYDLMDSYGIDKSQYTVSTPENNVYVVEYKGVIYDYIKDFDKLIEVLERE